MNVKQQLRYGHSIISALIFITVEWVIMCSILVTSVVQTCRRPMLDTIARTRRLIYEKLNKVKEDPPNAGWLRKRSRYWRLKMTLFRRLQELLQPVEGEGARQQDEAEVEEEEESFSLARIWVKYNIPFPRKFPAEILYNILDHFVQAENLAGRTDDSLPVPDSYFNSFEYYHALSQLQETGPLVRSWALKRMFSCVTLEEHTTRKFALAVVRRTPNAPDIFDRPKESSGQYVKSLVFEWQDHGRRGTVDGDLFRPIILACASLEFLRLHRASPEDISYISLASSESVIRATASLELLRWLTPSLDAALTSLWLSSVSIRFETGLAPGTFILPALVQIHLSNIDWTLEKMGIKKLIHPSAVPKLIAMTIAGERRFRDTPIDSLVRLGRQLRLLSMDHMKPIIEFFPNLQVLNLAPSAGQSLLGSLSLAYVKDNFTEGPKTLRFDFRLAQSARLTPWLLMIQLLQQGERRSAFARSIEKIEVLADQHEDEIHFSPARRRDRAIFEKTLLRFGIQFELIGDTSLKSQESIFRRWPFEPALMQKHTSEDAPIST